MRELSPNRACGHGNCKRAYSEHGESLKLCPGFEEPPYQSYKSAKRSVSASQSFTPAQVKLLDAVLRGLMTSGNPLARNAAMSGLMGKVATMRKRIDAMKGT